MKPKETEIVLLRSQGWSIGDIAKFFGLTRTLVAAIVRAHGLQRIVPEEKGATTP